MAPVLSLQDVRIPFLHINHLIANKKAVNRIKDQLDAVMPEKIREIKETDRDAGR